MAKIVKFKNGTYGVRILSISTNPLTFYEYIDLKNPSWSWLIESKDHQKIQGTLKQAQKTIIEYKKIKKNKFDKGKPIK